MKMDIYVLLIWFALPDFTIFVEGYRYYVSEQETEWGNGNCTLALPSLDYNDLGIFAETEKDTNWTLHEDGLWIGLFQAKLSFAYVGCNKLNDSGAVLSHNICECSWKSECDSFAIRKIDDEKIECKCLDTAVVASKSQCTSTCKRADAYKCGKEGNNYFSIYTVQNATKCFRHCGYASKTCLNRIRRKTYRWAICFQSNRQNKDCSDRPFTVRDIGPKVASSAVAGEKCFAKGLFPATLRHIESSIISNNKTYWTDIIRMNSMIRTDEKFYADGPKLYAYVQFDGKRLGVRFDDGRSVRRRSLCETPNFVATTATTIEGHSTLKIPETTENNRTITTVDQRVPVAEISASVSALVVVGICIVISVILRKRGGLRYFYDRKTTKANTELPMEYIDTEYTERQTCDHPKAYPNQGYSITEGLPISTTNKTSGKVQMTYDYVDVNKVVNSKNNPQDVQHTNVHNNVNKEVEEYDHVNYFGILSHDISQPINDYDSTTAAKGENQDDTYNHLNERPNLRRNTDNVYGVQNKNETTDIYNQLNERPERKHMENIYGLHDKNETENHYDITVETPVTCKNMSENTIGVNYDKVNKNW